MIERPSLLGLIFFPVLGCGLRFCERYRVTGTLNKVDYNTRNQSAAYAVRTERGQV